MTPLFQNQSLFTRLYPKLAHIPGIDGALAAGLAYCWPPSTGMLHFIDELDDYYAYPPFLIRALQTLREPSRTGSVHTAVSIGYSIRPFHVTEVDRWKNSFLCPPSFRQDAGGGSRRNGPELNRLEQEIGWLLHSAAQRLGHWMTDVQLGTAAIQGIVEIRKNDPFWLGLHLILFSCLERLIVSPVQTTPTQWFLSLKPGNAALASFFDAISASGNHQARDRLCNAVDCINNSYIITSLHYWAMPQRRFEPTSMTE